MTRFAGVALAGSVGAALARRLGGGRPAPAGPGALAGREHKLRGVEVFPGIGTPISRTDRYGATFIGMERGRTALVLAGWVNYTPIFFKPGTRCTVVGGHWFLAEIEGRRLGGVLYGSFGEGAIHWNRNGKLAEVGIRMEVSGGARAYRGFRGTGDLEGVLNHLPFPPLPPRVGVSLRLAPQAARSPEDPAGERDVRAS